VIGSGFPRPDFEFGLYLLDQLFGTLYITGGSHADMDLMPAGRVDFEKIVKTDNSKNLADRNPKVVGDFSLRFLRHITQFCLNFLKDMNQGIRIPIETGNNLIRLQKIFVIHSFSLCFLGKLS
jgi:hypothetical protein